jgi:hypothetical protein
MKGREAYSTPEMLAEETEVLASADNMAAKPSHQVSTTRLAVRLSLENAGALRRWLTLDRDPSVRADQREAIRFVTRRAGQLALLTAPAGTAKLDTISRLGQFY